MYRFDSSSICGYRDEREKPMTLFMLLLSMLVIMLMTSLMQTAILLATFMIMKFRSLLGAIPNEEFFDAFIRLLQEFVDSDLALLIQLFTTVSTIALTLILCISILRRRPASLALVRKGTVGHYALGLLLGCALFAAVFGIATINGALKVEGVSPSINGWMLAMIFVGYILQGASEEILFRGFLMCDLARRSSPVVAIFLSSLAFALAHHSNTGIGWIPLLNLFLFGILASILVLRTGNLFGACALHTAWNFTQGHVFGCRVSGLVPNSKLLMSFSDPAQSLTNGGAFGPEGGIAVTVVFLLFIVFLLVFPNGTKKNEAE